MKKIFTLIFVALTAMAAQATDYTNIPITVTVNGESSEQTGNITITENAGKYDLTLKNFILASADSPMAVGNVELKGIEPYQDGTTTLLVTNQTITITNGDDPSVSVWAGPLIGPVPVELRGKIENGHLRCYIDIDMQATLQQVIQVAVGEGYQIANPSFENWHASTDSYIEPNAWHSFESATGSLAALAGHHIAKSEDAHSGMASARIFATSIFGIVANGTMTTGRMNAGSMSAADNANHAFLDMSSTDLDGNGDPFYTPMYSRPDAIALWVKFKQDKPTAKFPYATVSAVITDGTRYQDPEDKAYTNVVAKAKNNTIAVTNGEWKHVVVPFEYTTNAVDPKAVLITISTNAEPGKGSDKDEVLVDDIAFIYNANLTSLKIKGQDVPQFSKDVLDYEMTIDQEITAADIEAVADSKAAHVMKTVETDATAGAYKCAITVFGGDMQAVKTYNVKVKSSATAIKNVQTAAQQTAFYSLDGRVERTLKPGRIYISRQADGTVKKVRF